jgi:hypothetical protein
MPNYTEQSFLDDKPAKKKPATPSIKRIYNPQINTTVDKDLYYKDSDGQLSKGKMGNHYGYEYSYPDGDSKYGKPKKKK